MKVILVCYLQNCMIYIFTLNHCVYEFYSNNNGNECRGMYFLNPKKRICRKITEEKCFIFSVLPTISRQADSYCETV